MRRTSLGARMAVKRALDVSVAVVLGVVLLPLWLAVAATILVLDGGPVLYRQRRIGRHGVPFTMYKFRTMVPDAHSQVGDLTHRNERRGPLFKVSDDPRVTGVGRLLRKTSVDELPQLWNVVRGDMSLVGPRPCLPEERDRFPADLMVREDLPQGMTGLWQVKGRDASEFDLYQRLDVEYVSSWSLRRDLWLLACTPLVVARGAVRRSPAPTVDDRGTTPPPPGRREPTLGVTPMELVGAAGADD